LETIKAAIPQKSGAVMNRLAACFATACVALPVALAAPAYAQEAHRYKIVDANGNIQALIAKHAAAYGVPELLIRRVIHRESRGNPRVISKGNYGLMQIRLGTARAMGYRGGTQGLLDADTNMTYAVKYLAGAYKVAGGNHDRAVQYYAAGYYFAAKRKGMIDGNDTTALASLASADGATGASATAASVKSPNPAYFQRQNANY
jgi:soluble lytic murein transglycosylase-like protein